MCFFWYLQYSCMTELLHHLPIGLPMKKNVTIYFHNSHLWNHRKLRYWAIGVPYQPKLLGWIRLCIPSIIHLWVFILPSFLSWPMSLISPHLFLMSWRRITSDGAIWINSLTSVLTKQNLDTLRREVTIKVLLVEWPLTFRLFNIYYSGAIKNWNSWKIPFSFWRSTEEMICYRPMPSKSLNLL